MDETVEQRITRVLAALKKVPAEKITPDSNLQELGMDSLDAVNLLFELENEFNLSIPDEFTQGITTVRQIAERMTQLLSNASARTGTA
jgi:acyl carrier protein